MKFKIDENIPINALNLFRERGYDCSSTYQEKLNGEEDKKILQKVRKDSRILITLDMDFSDIRFNPPENSPGCMVLKVKNQSKNDVLHG